MNELYLKLDKNISIIITGKKNTLHVKFSILLAVWEYDAENTMVHSSPSGTTRKHTFGFLLFLHGMALFRINLLMYLPHKQFKQHTAKRKPVSTGVICFAFLQNFWSHVAMSSTKQIPQNS